jgi:hypothetical protein
MEKGLKSISKVFGAHCLSFYLPVSPELLADDTSKGGTHNTICSNTYDKMFFEYCKITLRSLESRLNGKFGSIPPIYQVNKCVPLFTKRLA